LTEPAVIPATILSVEHDVITIIGIVTIESALNSSE
jgi:hypothetical protein